MTDIQVGDVCLDLAQGRPVHVVEDTEMNAFEWSQANNYELAENYGNDRLGTTDSDHVFEVVYCSSLKSEPSKTYAMPESRLGRVETESADDGLPVADRVRRETLARLFQISAEFEDAPAAGDLRKMANQAGFLPEVVDVAQELADVEETIGGDS